MICCITYSHNIWRFEINHLQSMKPGHWKIQMAQVFLELLYGDGFCCLILLMCHWCVWSLHARLCFSMFGIMLLRPTTSLSWLILAVAIWINLAMCMLMLLFMTEVPSYLFMCQPNSYLLYLATVIFKKSYNSLLKSLLNLKFIRTAFSRLNNFQKWVLDLNLATGKHNQQLLFVDISKPYLW